MENKVIENLVEKAIEARNMAYAPYSGFKVGAALLDASGGIHLGCNIENAAYSPTNCAERTAFFKAVSEGERDFAAIAVAGGPRDAREDELVNAFPCGVCRQVMKEFCGDDFIIVSAKSPRDYRILTLKEILPEAFGPADLGR